MKFKSIDCPICNNSEFVFLFSKKDQKFVRCNSCELVYINPQPSVEALSATYDDEYADLYIKKSKSKYKRSYRRVKKLIKINKKAKSFLDIGCSAGFVVKAAVDLGLDSYGVEVEKSGPLYAKNILGLKNIYNGFLQDAGYEDKQFDIITFYEVLEHIPEPNEFLQEVNRILKDDGIVQISVPDAGHWTVRKNLSKWDAILPSEHLWYFNSKNLTKLLEKNEFKVISVSSRILKAGLKITFKKNTI